MLTPRTMFRVAASVAVVAVCSACVPASGPGSPSGASAAGWNRGVISVGSFDFPESGLLAEIYGQALAAHGFRIRIMPGDRVKVQLSPYDLNRGRIVYRYK